MANTTQKFADQAKETAAHATDKAKETASTVLDKAKDIGSAALGKAGEAASWVGQKADDGVSAVGSGMRSLGETIRDKGPQSGILGGAASALGSGLENAGEYVERGISGMGQDLGAVIRRNPLVSVLIGVGLGFMLARLTSSRS